MLGEFRGLDGSDVFGFNGSERRPASLEIASWAIAHSQCCEVSILSATRGSSVCSGATDLVSNPKQPLSIWRQVSAGSDSGWSSLWQFLVCWWRRSQMWLRRRWLDTRTPILRSRGLWESRLRNQFRLGRN